DGDGFIDHAYFGDIHGNMWQVKFCTQADLTSNPNCGISNWQGSLLLHHRGSSSYPIYERPTVAEDNNGALWVYWATGDIVNPTATEPAAIVYGVKALLCVDSNGNPSPCSRSGLVNISSNWQAYCNAAVTAPNEIGWYMTLSGTSEKVLAPLVVFNNVLYFTSFV